MKFNEIKSRLSSAISLLENHSNSQLLSDIQPLLNLFEIALDTCGQHESTIQKLKDEINKLKEYDFLYP